MSLFAGPGIDSPEVRTLAYLEEVAIGEAKYETLSIFFTLLWLLWCCHFSFLNNKVSKWINFIFTIYTPMNHCLRKSGLIFKVKDTIMWIIIGLKTFIWSWLDIRTLICFNDFLFVRCTFFNSLSKFKIYSKKSHNHSQEKMFFRNVENRMRDIEWSHDKVVQRTSCRF